jgi:tetratricopeptide (TPR) repeat protein
MTKSQRIRKQNILREAEGYLELITVCADRWPPAPALRDRIAARVFETLDRLEGTSYRRGHVLFLQGQTLRAVERYREAVTALKESLRLDPENVSSLLSLGWCYKRTGRIDLAVEALEDALEIEPASALIHYNLACYWSLAGKVKMAVSYLGKAFDLDPNYRDLVSDERDFDPIRNHPDFLALASVIV